MGLTPEQLSERFFGNGSVAGVCRFGNGHINETFMVSLTDGREAVVQRINEHVFPDPTALMGNIERVCRHLSQKYAHLPDAERRHLTLCPTPAGKCYLHDEEGKFWRAYRRVVNVRSFDAISEPPQAYHVGKAFAEFQAMLSDLPGDRLHDTIPYFHHTPRRFETFSRALQADPQRRSEKARAEIDFVLERQGWLARLIDLHLPERITHNDTKLNNLLFDVAGQQALCVVDLDTVMPGLVHYDFGDMIRTATNRRDEDEKDVSLIEADSEVFQHMARGYLEGGASFLIEAEKRELVFSGILMTLEVGMRFLTDFLEGDHYFRIHHPDHNLQRCRAQFALVKSLERLRPQWEDIVAGYSAVFLR